PIVVHEELAADGDEIPEEVDEGIAPHYRNYDGSARLRLRRRRPVHVVLGDGTKDGIDEAWIQPGVERLAVHHHRSNLPCCADVGQRIALDQDDVRDTAGADRAEIL